MRKLFRPWQRVALLLGILLSIYFVMRLINLTKLPIFTDEAIYIRWSQIGSRDANWRFISLTDGKQPMFTWIMMVLLRLIPDPLFAGRLVSVLAGAFSLVGIWLLSIELFKNNKAALIACLLYLFVPFTLMYDRMALYDSLVGAFSIWSLYVSILLVRKPRLDKAMILGMILGLGMLNKSSGFFSLYLLPFTLVLFDWKTTQKFKQLFRWLMCVFLSAVISQAMYGVLRLSPFYHMISLKDSVFVYPIGEWIKHPFLFAVGNIRGLFDWLWHYMTLPIFVASLVPLFVIGKDTKSKVILYAYWVLPFIALAMFGKVLYPRFILFMSMPLLVLAGVSIKELIGKLGNSVFALGIYVMLLFPLLYTDYFILTNPIYAPIPTSDKTQFVDDWPAGGGVKEVNQYILEKSMIGNVSVFTEGTFGLLPYAVEIYLVYKPSIHIKGIWPLPEHIPQEMIVAAVNHPTYFIMNQTQEKPALWPLEFISEYQKGNREDRKLRLYRVIPKVASI